MNTRPQMAVGSQRQPKYLWLRSGGFRLRHHAAERDGQFRCDLMHNPAKNRQPVVGQPAGHAGHRNRGKRFRCNRCRPRRRCSHARTIGSGAGGASRRPVQDALFLSLDGLFMTRRAQIAEFALRQKIALFAPFREDAEAALKPTMHPAPHPTR